ncbi:MAG TPA: DUF2752 domain-containing protein [Verrucomicrobiae bacterium]|nr:DUF2752 domain-containing protein [Verrucomicrobiae bacterium]
MPPAESQTVPPKIPAPPSLTMFVVVVAGVTMAGAGAVLYFFNPSTHGFYPVCEFHELTGLNCPGCGGTRAAYQLLHGHVVQALHDNALLVLSLAALAGRGVWFAARKLRNQPAVPFLPSRALWAFLGIAAVFTVLRNLPAFHWLSP